MSRHPSVPVPAYIYPCESAPETALALVKSVMRCRPLWRHPRWWPKNWQKEKSGTDWRAVSGAQATAVKGYIRNSSGRPKVRVLVLGGPPSKSGSHVVCGTRLSQEAGYSSPAWRKQGVAKGRVPELETTIWMQIPSRHVTQEVDIMAN